MALLYKHRKGNMYGINSNVLWCNFIKNIIKIGLKDYKSPLYNKVCKICIGKRKKRDKSLKSHHEMMA